MAEALQKYYGDVHFLGPVTPQPQLLFAKALNQLTLLFLKKRFDYRHSVFLSKSYSSLFKKKLNKEFDVIVAPASSTEIGYLETKVPIAYISDSTFALSKGYHKATSDLLPVSEREGEMIEKKAIEKASFLIYPTEWAARSAIDHYKADPKKVHVLPFGANMDNMPTKEQVMSYKRESKCRLLFLGVKWEAKGGDIAFECLKELQKMDVDATLTICGTVPPDFVSHPHLTVIPFLDKNDPEQLHQLQQLFLNSDFLILPTRAECYGIVFCEASAFGLPSIATHTGGTPGVITEGENGFLLPFNAGGKEYAEKIKQLYDDPELYLKIRKSSRKMFEEKLNWQSWVETLKKIIETSTVS